MTRKRKVLFICNYNSARSQMAEAFLKRNGEHLFEVESAGMRSGTINPDVIEVMLEIGIDLRNAAALSVFNLSLAGYTYDAIVALCDQRELEGCPRFPGAIRRLSWPFKDPATFQGSRVEVLEQVRQLRNQISQKTKEFVREASQPTFWSTSPGAE